MHVYSIGKKCSLVLGDINPDGQNFQIFCQFEQTKWRYVGHFELDPDDTSQDSWEDCNKCGRTDGAQIIIPHKKHFFSGG